MKVLSMDNQKYNPAEDIRRAREFELFKASLPSTSRKRVYYSVQKHWDAKAQSRFEKASGHTIPEGDKFIEGFLIRDIYWVVVFRRSLGVKVFLKMNRHIDTKSKFLRVHTSTSHVAVEHSYYVNSEENISILSELQYIITQEESLI